MISFDEMVDQPNWLGYTGLVATFSRLIRCDAGGLGLSDSYQATGRPPLSCGRATCSAVRDAAGRTSRGAERVAGSGPEHSRTERERHTRDSTSGSRSATGSLHLWVRCVNP